MKVAPAHHRERHSQRGPDIGRHNVLLCAANTAPDWVSGATDSTTVGYEAATFLEIESCQEVFHCLSVLNEYLFKLHVLEN